MDPNGDTPGLRLGLIGCGQWGLNYIRTFGELDDCNLVAACDLHTDRLSIARRHRPDLTITRNLDELLHDPRVQAVIVATEATSHFSIVRSAILAGKDCLVEKPLTVKPEEARQLRDLARTRDRLLMVGHVFRYNPAIDYVRRFLMSGALGQLEYLYFTRTNLGPIRSDVNVAWDLMTHDVSILLHFLNAGPTWVSAQGACYLRKGYEDVAFATLGFANGIIANLRASWLDPRKVREITLVGTSKMVVIDDLNASEPVRIFDKGTLRARSYQTFGEFKLVTRTGDVICPAVPASEPLRNQCQHFLEAIRTKRPVLSDADDGVRVVEILDAIGRSIAQKGMPIALGNELVRA